MNLLSPFTYYRRHARRALLLTILLALAVMGLYLLVGLLQETYIAPLYTINRYLTKFNLVQPDGANALAPTVIAQIRAHPDVAQTLPQNNVEILVPNVGGLSFDFRLLGLRATDVDTVLAQSGVALVEGQLPPPRTNGVALSQEIATALGLEIGDTFDWTRDDFAYAGIVSPLQVVGLLSGDVRLGIVSYEYLDSHERYRDIASYGLLVIARLGREAAVDDFLRQTIRSSRTKIYTRQTLAEEVARSESSLYMVAIPVMLVVAAAVTLVIGAINRLAFMQRLPEFGTLHAVGLSKGWLARRLTLEMAGPAAIGWAVGILMALGGMAILNAVVYTPQGFAYNPLQGAAFLLVIPLPLVVIGSTLFTAARVLRRMDAVAIVERGELSLEEKRTAPGRSGKLLRPLASTTFYRRHKGQAVGLIGATALMIVGTALLVFILGAATDAMQPPLNGLTRMSLVSPKGLPLDMTVTAQIRAHPAVERAIPAIIFSPLEMAIPPLLSDYPLEAYAVGAEDMTYLVELYGLKLAAGHLPRPNTNDIVLPWAAAQNRDVHVGDVIGSRAQPIYPGAPTLPSELVVSGIFAPAENPAENTWFSFISQEFVNDYRSDWKGELSLIVVPKAKQRAALDEWLESEMGGARRTVFTYSNQQAWFQETTNIVLFTFSLMESVIALVAALALAGLNHIFVTQRRTEMGVLNALGFSRRQLVGRIARETLFTTGAAWLVGVVGCAVILLYLQHALYAPAGLNLNFFNPIPWLYTLPVPVAVLAVTSSAIARTLSKLDPVTIIERR
ncbi:MAG: ABC transporter permease [Anaerolineae bacterium]|nr:ABC transporter permease [Anaerolineae bacterium]